MPLGTPVDGSPVIHRDDSQRRCSKEEVALDALADLAKDNHDVAVHFAKAPATKFKHRCAFFLIIFSWSLNFDHTRVSTYPPLT
jgi:hypothetical protein